MRGMRLALDIDGTITGDPGFFVRISREVIERGGDVHVVSSRSPESRSETLSELRQLGLQFTALHLIAGIESAQKLCPHRDLDWFQRYLWLKVDYALAHKITHFVDDDAKVLELLVRFAPTIKAINFREREVMLRI